MNNNYLKKDTERIDNLQRNGLRIIQDSEAFCFGIDAILLTAFTNVKRHDIVIDIGTGSGVIPILLSVRSQASRLIGLEIQPTMADMARRSVLLNGLEDRIEIMQMDLRNANKTLGYGCADCVVCNPPYGKEGANRINQNESIRIARHEVCCTLEDCVRSAAELLKNGGRASFIHRSERFMDLAQHMVAHKLEPKRVCLIQPMADKPPNLIMVEGIKQGRSGLKWLSPVIIYKSPGIYSEKVLRMYHMEAGQNMA